MALGVGRSDTKCRLAAGNPDCAPAFTSILTLDWYDGPIEAIVQCADCSAVYWLGLVDDELGHETEIYMGREVVRDTRIFSLSPLPAEYFDALLALCPEGKPPPWGTRPPLWRIDSEGERRAFEDAVRSAVSQASPPVCVAVSDNALERVSMSRPVTEADISSTTAWFSYLGLTRWETANGA